MSLSDDVLELMARAHDEIVENQEGVDCSPWHFIDLCAGVEYAEQIRADRMAAIDAAIAAMVETAKDTTMHAEPGTHFRSLELLLHYRCYACDQWWSVADGLSLDRSMTCPSCGSAEERAP